MKDTQSRELYSSPNGDRWHLCKDASGIVFVLHQANIPSGGQTSRIELSDFLTGEIWPRATSLSSNDWNTRRLVKSEGCELTGYTHCTIQFDFHKAAKKLSTSPPSARWSMKRCQ